MKSKTRRQTDIRYRKGKGSSVYPSRVNTRPACFTIAYDRFYVGFVLRDKTIQILEPTGADHKNSPNRNGTHLQQQHHGRLILLQL